MASSRSYNRSLSLVLLAAIGSACGSDSSSGGLGGSNAIGGSTGGAGAPGGSGGDGATAGTGGGAGASGVPVTPDPLKDCGTPDSPAVPELALTQLASGLERPVYLTQPRGDSARLFVLEKSGQIRILRDGALVEAPFLTIAGVSERSGDAAEMGLLGLAFHPQYADNGRFYVYYSTLIDGAHYGRLAEYHVSADNPDTADAGSERVLLDVSEPQDNHNGGDLEFGRDGFLYFGLGDGGGGGDQHGSIGNGQNLQTHLGKILRLDVDGSGAGPNGNYGIPSGNLTENALPEIWSYGLRNPWRFSFDACTGDMYIADVGQGQIEELDFEPPGAGGRNYGWRLMEGDACFNPNSGCNAATQNLVLPVATYDHGVGISITGGYVYRAAAIPSLRGTYLYADYGSSRFFALRMAADGSIAVPQVDISDNINPGLSVQDITSFGQDGPGNVYVLTLSGGVYRVDAE